MRRYGWAGSVVLFGVVALLAQGCNYAWVKKSHLRDLEQAAAKWKEKYDELDSYYQAQITLNATLTEERDKAKKDLAEAQKSIEMLRAINQKLADQRDVAEIRKLYEKRVQELTARIQDLTRKLEGYGTPTTVYLGPTRTVAGDVLFDAGKAVIKPAGKKALDKIVPDLKKTRGQILIAGHTDSDPIKVSGWDSNLHLSGRRALAVLEYLKKKGIPEERMHFAGFGAHHVIKRGGREDKAASRRVEIILLGQKGVASPPRPEKGSTAPAPEKPPTKEPPVK